MSIRALAAARGHARAGRSGRRAVAPAARRSGGEDAAAGARVRVRGLPAVPRGRDRAVARGERGGRPPRRAHAVTWTRTRRPRRRRSRRPVPRRNRQRAAAIEEDRKMHADLSRRGLAVLVLSAALAGCTTFSPDGGFDEVRKLAGERIGQDVRWQRTDEDAQSAAADGEATARAAARRGRRGADRAAQQPRAAGHVRRARHRRGRRRAGGPHRATRGSRTCAPTHDGERKLEWALTFPIFDLITMPLRTTHRRRSASSARSSRPRAARSTSRSRRARPGSPRSPPRRRCATWSR